VASYKATNAPHWAMCIASYRPGGMTIKIIIYLPAFFVIVDSLFAHNVS
jgi:hypothetical protein